MGNNGKLLFCIVAVIMAVALIEAKKKGTPCIQRFSETSMKRFENISKICVTELKLFTETNKHESDEDDLDDEEIANNEESSEKMVHILLKRKVLFYFCTEVHIFFKKSHFICRLASQIAQWKLWAW